MREGGREGGREGSTSKQQCKSSLTSTNRRRHALFSQVYMIYLGSHCGQGMVIQRSSMCVWRQQEIIDGSVASAYQHVLYVAYTITHAGIGSVLL